MALYMVSYDICDESKKRGNWDSIFKTLSSFPNSLHIQKSVFFIDSKKSSKQIFQSIERFLHVDDIMCIVRVDASDVVCHGTTHAQHLWLQNFVAPPAPPKKLW